VIEIPKSYNYISAFLTFGCNFNCSYCINKYGGLFKYKSMDLSDWIRGLNRIKTRSDLPITISGGEPTLHPDFYTIIKWIDGNIPLDLLTNGEFDVDEFMEHINPHRFQRKAPYASIRFSYHPGYTNIIRLLRKVNVLKNRGYSVGIWAVNKNKIHSKLVQLLAKSFGIDFRLKEYLDETHGNYKYPHGLNGFPKKCLCKPSELLIAPDGRLFRCHHDLYGGINSIGHILNNKVKLPEDFIPCSSYGNCNPCDLKLKFNRFQQDGHCAVEIKNG